MRPVIVLCLSLALAGAAHAKGVRFRVVDADNGSPIAGATVERCASQWQPRILLPPGRFWFPAGKATTDAEGSASFDLVAGDDRYYIKAEGYDEGLVTRGWLRFRLVSGSGDPRDVAERSGVLTVPVRRNERK